MTALTLAPDDVLSWTEVVIRLLAATGIGGAIGLNRELTRKPAGLRTHALVALGSALATVSAIQLGGPAGASHGDPTSRVIQGIVAGIGFIGGGAILKGDENVRGTATAASIWNVGVIGAAVGFGMYSIAIILALANIALLRVMVPIKREIYRKGSAQRNADEN